MGSARYVLRKALRHVWSGAGGSYLRLVGSEVGFSEYTRHDTKNFHDPMDSVSRYCLQMCRHDAIAALLVGIGAVCHLRAWSGQTQNVQMECGWTLQATATEEVQNTAHGDKLRTTGIQI